ncbi:alpha/beta hydrolase [Pseudomonas syringae]|uniref:Pimeloyl-ACP methyl ester carboxylesterase n=1 Tax=Pseudomonas syringae TaxID=317 RepID=A0AB37ZDV3_PSESX|nr:alpha/beta hydrolase [Pseudomonas syringae]MBI6666640.1 alpha/beta hydrolase [Pseudomonas syringae]MBI6679173.1 alpha/beta hydrolase [Pseudomonas syringae]MBI6839856.1 alpha/beta hydrolase [Pseudomonas syringae]NAP18564.1 alpha/beta fold hydrolase [Pseudomonas syringae]NAQ16554.1 alpha/beta fold hydrolase [Pseudomonas syringae]
MKEPEHIEMSWRSVDVGGGVRIRYGVAGTGHKPVLLIHGYPETAIAWRRIVRPLVEQGYKVIAPDVRGAGGSSRPLHGYDKSTMAQDCSVVLRDAGVLERALIVGHDIGLMIAYAFARKYPESTRGIAVLDAPLPGTAAFDQVSLDDRRVWHFHFHQAPDIPEALTAGKEAYYLERFWHDLAYDAGAIDEVTKASYISSFSGPGGMRAGFELYRSFAADAEFNRAQLAARGKTKIPVLALAGESSAFSTIMKSMMEEVAEKVSFAVISNAGHWLAEENPSAVAHAMINFDQSILDHDG